MRTQMYGIDTSTTQIVIDRKLFEARAERRQDHLARLATEHEASKATAASPLGSLKYFLTGGLARAR